MDLIHDSLSRMGAKDIRSTPEGWECLCPMRSCGSNRRSFRVSYVGKNQRPGEFFCHKCECRGDLVTLVMRSQRVNRGQAETIVGEVVPYFRRRKRQEVEWQRPDISEHAPYRSVCSEYLLSRGFPEEWIWHYGIGMDLWSNEIVIATKDLIGQLVGITRRIAAEGFPYYHSKFPKSKFLWGLDLAVKSGESTVYVTEGQADPLGLASLIAPCPVVASYGSHLSGEQADLLAEYFATVVLAYDNDSAGYRGIEAAVPLLRSRGVTDIFVLDYDANDPGKLPGVENPNLQHLSYIQWRRIKERPPIKRKRNHATWKQCG